MDLSKIISISGHPGLYKVIAQTNNGFIVESLLDKKRIPAYSHYRISGLSEISIFTTAEDKPLKEVYKSIFEKENGGLALDHKSSDEELKKYFETILPDYDKERVRISDMRKAIQWYNTIHPTGLLSAPDPDDEANALSDEKKSQESVKAKSAKPQQAKQLKTKAPKVKAAGVRKTGGGA